MYDIRQFRPALYVLLLMGLAGFAMASLSPGVWVLGTIGIVLNAWLVATDRFVPMPRLMANLVTLASLVYIARQIFAPGTTPVLVIGQFLVLLQLIKLWEQRANRDYAQLIVLSLLLMVAAAINTASLVFGVLFIAYLFLSLYCCLLFHLKVESDAARTTFALPADKVNPQTLRQDQRYLSQSMRRLTGLAAAVSIALAVIVFLFFPRGAGAGLFGNIQIRPADTLTGFSEQVGFQNIAKISQNNEIVAYVTLTRDGQPVRGGAPLLMRGVTLDAYNGANTERGARWQWTRTQFLEPPQGIDSGQTRWLDERFPQPPAEQWKQKISLKPTGTTVLFALAGPVSFTPLTRDLRIRFAFRDGVIQTYEAIQYPIEYEVVSRNNLNSPGRPPVRTRLEERRQERRVLPSAEGGDIDDRVGEYARRPEVGGSDAQGPLAVPSRRDPMEFVTELDEPIARAIERHLQTQFAYTLDLTDARRIRDEDPMVSFLYDLKRGHCEYFAGAMTLMCQKLGLQARMVVGFKCDEFNEMGGYFIVRQSHAHAWVEVLTTGGWKTFDPTSGREAAGATEKRGFWQSVKHFFNYLEFTYGNSVIAYDNDNRASLIQNMEASMGGAAAGSGAAYSRFREWFGSAGFWNLSSTALAGFVGLMVLVCLAFVGWFLWEKWAMRRRAARIGIESLPASDQLRLARQLGFYDDLMLLLARHHIARPRHQTPLEFSRSLMFLPSDVYETVRRLTEVFYRVRYGRAELDAGKQRRLAGVIDRVSGDLGASDITSAQPHAPAPDVAAPSNGNGGASSRA